MVLDKTNRFLNILQLGKKEYYYSIGFMRGKACNVHKMIAIKDSHSKAFLLWVYITIQTLEIKKLKSFFSL